MDEEAEAGNGKVGLGLSDFIGDHGPNEQTLCLEGVSPRGSENAGPIRPHQLQQEPVLHPTVKQP